MKNLIKQLVFKYFGYFLHRGIPFGIDPVADIKRKFPKYSWHTILDVGANTGQSLSYFKSALPKIKMYCFEPIPAVFESLELEARNYNNVVCINRALGAHTKQVLLNLEADQLNHSDRISLRDEHESSASAQQLVIDVDTLNIWFQTEKLNQGISYLKIDTEGYDLEVLQGATKLLNEKSIDFIEVEAGVNPSNEFHVSMEELKSFAEQFGYRVFGFYSQVHEWPTEEQILRRVNMVLVSPKVFKQ